MHVQTFMVQLSDNNYVYRQNTCIKDICEIFASIGGFLGIGH